MPLFRVSIDGAKPLQMRLSTSSSVGAEVVGWSAYGETTTGETSRPILYRPSNPGRSRSTGETAIISCLSRPGLVQPNTAAATVFAVAPSLPEAKKTTGNLPFRCGARWPRGKGMVLLPSSHIMLYAWVGSDRTGQTHSWEAEMLWEED